MGDVVPISPVHPKLRDWSLIREKWSPYHPETGKVLTAYDGKALRGMIQYNILKK